MEGATPLFWPLVRHKGGGNCVTLALTLFPPPFLWGSLPPPPVAADRHGRCAGGAGTTSKPAT